MSAPCLYLLTKVSEHFGLRAECDHRHERLPRENKTIGIPKERAWLPNPGYLLLRQMEAYGTSAHPWTNISPDVVPTDLEEVQRGTFINARNELDTCHYSNVRTTGKPVCLYFNTQKHCSSKWACHRHLCVLTTQIRRYASRLDTHDNFHWRWNITKLNNNNKKKNNNKNNNNEVMQEFWSCWQHWRTNGRSKFHFLCTFQCRFHVPNFGKLRPFTIEFFYVGHTHWGWTTNTDVHFVRRIIIRAEFLYERCLSRIDI
jgi:hypothetical protein